ncbi:MAG: FGGY family carbohydrate kinase [Candidatus Neomarinimicrobiota bacterium]
MLITSSVINSKILYYLVLDQGTSSSKIFLFDNEQNIVFSDRERHRLHRPQEHHVESNPIDILNACSKLITSAISYAKSKNSNIVSMGMAVQRSTFLFWDKQHLKHYTQAISWQDSRAQKESEAFTKYAIKIKEITGVPLSAHFGAPKYIHFTKHDSVLKRKTENNKLWFGPLSAYLTHSFTSIPAVDESIAGRSLLMNLGEIVWDEELCSLFGIPTACLPPLKPTVHDFGSVEIDDVQIPLNCVIGDQQAALVGQGGSTPGSLAMNFGTSGSVQYNTGTEPRRVPRLLSNVLYSTASTRNYLLEGTISACSSLFYWLEGELNIPHNKMFWDKRCENTSTQGVLIPGFVGLAAPYWIDGFEAVYHNLDGTSNNEIIRAGMETIGFLVHDIFKSIASKTKLNQKLITVSGGSARDPLLQFISDLLQIKIGHTALKDRTALGVYKLLRLRDDKFNADESVECDKIFSPKMDSLLRKEKLQNWRIALKKIS